MSIDWTARRRARAEAIRKFGVEVGEHITLNWPCKNCGHEKRHHPKDSFTACTEMGAPDLNKNRWRCLCTGYVPRPPAGEAHWYTGVGGTTPCACTHERASHRLKRDPVPHAPCEECSCGDFVQFNELCRCEHRFKAHMQDGREHRCWVMDCDCDGFTRMIV